jgi:hypothetical protein
LNYLPGEVKDTLRASSASAKRELIKNNPEYYQRQQKKNLKLSREGTVARRYAKHHLELRLDPHKQKSVDSVRKAVKDYTGRDIATKIFKEKIARWEQNPDGYVSDGRDQ